MPTLLRLVASAVAGPPGDGAASTPADVTVVLDTTWTAPDASAAAGGAASPAGRVIAVRDVGERVLADRDLITETSEHLDRWAAGSGVIDRLTLRDTSFWYYVRLRHWMWLQERILWAAIVDALVTDHRPATIACGAGVDAAILDVVRLIAARDGLDVVDEAADAPAADAPTKPAAARTPRPPFHARLIRRLRKVMGLSVPPDATQRRLALQDERRAIVRARLEALAQEPGGRLLVVHEHAQQLVETPDGPRQMNPYLDPIMERLRGTRLEPVALDIRAHVANEAAWERLGGTGAARELPADVLVLDQSPAHTAGQAHLPHNGDGEGEAAAAASAWTPTHVPIVTAGVDLAPILVAEVSGAAARWMPGISGAVDRITHLLERLRPAGILLADEYHRQDWLAAAHGLGIPVAAVQHGMIYPRHNGYMHGSRPATLRLPQRLYVFGRWERDLLVGRSVFREDEVSVSGSPRLDLVAPMDPAARDDVRRELGVADGGRLVLVSGTWGGLYRRFHYPIALAHLVDRPLPGVHFVVKLHPGEPDLGPYRAVIERAAAAGGFAPPPVSCVRSVDLYRILAAADAHLGIHSTVLTEAVVTRTPNLLADHLAGADLLGYVPAGVAIPVRAGGDLLAALALGERAMDEADARAFTEAHFEPGIASERIAADLLAWLP